METLIPRQVKQQKCRSDMPWQVGILRWGYWIFAHAKVPQWSNGKVPWFWEQWYQDPHKIIIGNHSFFR